MGDLKGATWEEKEIALSGINQNDVIEYIGLRVKGSASDSYKMLVGQLQLCDDRSAVKPADIDDLECSYRSEGRNDFWMSAKLTWSVDYTGFSPARKRLWYGLQRRGKYRSFRNFV